MDVAQRPLQQSCCNCSRVWRRQPQPKRLDVALGHTDLGLGRNKLLYRKFRLADCAACLSKRECIGSPCQFADLLSSHHHEYNARVARTLKMKMPQCTLTVLLASERLLGLNLRDPPSQLFVQSQRHSQWRDNKSRPSRCLAFHSPQST